MILRSVWHAGACPVGGVGGISSVRYAGQEKVTVFIVAGLEGKVHP